MSRWTRIALLFGLFMVSPVLWAAGHTLESIHLSQHGNQTTVRFDLDSAPKYRHFSLSNPSRAVIDFKDTRAADSVTKVSGGAVTDVRIGRHTGGRLRAVFDLADGADLDDIQVDDNQVIARFHGTSKDSGSDPKAKHEDASAAHHTHAAADTDTQSTDAPGEEPEALYRATKKTGPVVVVIDPGHGGHDPGTHAASGLKEKTVTLSIAKTLYNKLKAAPSVHPILTRSDDRFITLRQRVRIAQKHHANLFISIHENSSPHDKSARGGTCYILSRHGASNAKAAQLAHFENSADHSLAGVHFSGDHTLNAVLTDLYQNAAIDSADTLARSIISQFSQVGPIYQQTPPRANFAVLRDPMIPSVLCETSFLSNAHQARLLSGSHFRKQLANAMYAGVMDYFRAHPPGQMQAVGGTVYTVKAGDTLSGIAAHQGVSENALMDINHLHTKKLKAGQKLQLPGG